VLPTRSTPRVGTSDTLDTPRHALDTLDTANTPHIDTDIDTLTHHAYEVSI
jgi:hypothetical protein